MTKQEYDTVFGPPTKDWDSKAVLLRTAIENAKKREGRLAGYRKLKKWQLIQVAKRQAL